LERIKIQCGTGIVFFFFCWRGTGMVVWIPFIKGEAETIRRRERCERKERQERENREKKNDEKKNIN